MQGGKVKLITFQIPLMFKIVKKYICNAFVISKTSKSSDPRSMTHSRENQFRIKFHEIKSHYEW